MIATILMRGIKRKRAKRNRVPATEVQPRETAAKLMDLIRSDVREIGSVLDIAERFLNDSGHDNARTVSPMFDKGAQLFGSAQVLLRKMEVMQQDMPLRGADRRGEFREVVAQIDVEGKAKKLLSRMGQWKRKAMRK